MNMREISDHFKNSLGAADARIVAIITIAVCAVLNIYFNFPLFTSIFLAIGIYLALILFFVLYYKLKK